MLPSSRRNVLMPLSGVFDLAAVSTVFLITLAISSGSLTWPGLAEVLVIRVKLGNIFVFGGYLVFCSAVFSKCGLYRSHRLSRWRERLCETLLAVTFITAALPVLKWLFLLSFAIREFLTLFWLLTLCTLFLSHEVGHQLLYLARSRGRNLRNVIIVGEGPYVTALADRVGQETSLGYRILRVIDAREMATNGRIGSDIGT
jgi:FlaA1/EpsC-like NDP-sugar epimerase